MNLIDVVVMALFILELLQALIVRDRAYKWTRPLVHSSADLRVPA